MSFNLLRRACRHFPRHLEHHDHNRRAWLRSVTILRERGLWVLEGGLAKFHSDAK